MKTHSRILVRLALALAALALDPLTVQPAGAGSFTTTGPLSGARAGHAATLLRNGKVLVEGGYDGTGPGRLASAELYNPAAATWAATGFLNLGRTTHTATLLPDGRVLVAGGHDSGSTSTATCEVYDPVGGTWTFTNAMASPRGNHTATLLLNGRVLVASGHSRSGNYEVATAELYDPATGTWASAGSLANARDFHTATLLLDGRVLVAGGGPDGLQSTSLSSVEIYDPATGLWTTTGSMLAARQGHTATLLPNGQVLAVGGNHNDVFNPSTVTISSAELYDPASGTWAATGSLNAARTTHTATLLASGKVLIAAGYNYNGNFWLTGSELYDSAVGPLTLVNPVRLPGGGFRFGFIGAANGTNSILTTTNPALNSTNWTVLGVAPQFAPGLFAFSDPQVTNSLRRFYSVRSP